MGPLCGLMGQMQPKEANKWDSGGDGGTCQLVSC